MCIRDRAYHKDKFEDYEILCNAAEGFIDENSINGDFNPWSFDYNDVCLLYTSRCV